MMNLSLKQGLAVVLLSAFVVACSDKELPKKFEEPIKKEKEENKPSDKDEKQKDEASEEQKDKTKKEDGKKEESKKDETKPEDPKEKEDEVKPEEKKEDGQSVEKEKQDEGNATEKEKEETKPAEEAVKPSGEDTSDAMEKLHAASGSSIVEGVDYIGDLAPKMDLNPVIYVEYTGQKCLYCPNYKRAKEASQKQYGKERYLYVESHSEKDSSPELYNKEAEEYRRFMEGDIKGLPGGDYNRLGKTFHPLYDKSLKEMLLTPDFLECTGSVNVASDNKINVSLKTRLRSDRTDYIKGKKLDVLLWILENGVKAYQQDAGDSRYHTWPLHKHIFRSSLNGHWGQPFLVGESYSGSFTIPKNIQQIKNCEIIVLILERDTKVILDAAQFDVK